MKPLTKTIIAAASIALIGLAAFGKKKYDSAVSVLYNLSFKLKNLSNINFSLPMVTFYANIEVYNPTSTEFTASFGNMVAIREVRIYDYKNTYLGYANGFVSHIELPANTKTLLPKMKFNVDVFKLMGNVTSNITSYINYDFTMLKYEIDIEAFGKIITLEA